MKSKSGATGLRFSGSFPNPCDTQNEDLSDVATHREPYMSSTDVDGSLASGSMVRVWHFQDSCEDIGRVQPQYGELQAMYHQV